jgi:hypothetical protein
VTSLVIESSARDAAGGSAERPVRRRGRIRARPRRHCTNSWDTTAPCSPSIRDEAPRIGFTPAQLAAPRSWQAGTPLLAGRHPAPGNPAPRSWQPGTPLLAMGDEAPRIGSRRTERSGSRGSADRSTPRKRPLSGACFDVSMATRRETDVKVTMVGDWLGRWRIAVGVSQRTLAAHAGISQSGISRLERGLQVVGGRRLARIIDALDTLGELAPTGPIAPPPFRRPPAHCQTRHELSASVPTEVAEPWTDR